LDTITEQKSSIEDAGRGAFATRAMSKGSVVSASPLVSITQQQVLEIQNAADKGNATHQLLWNYCYGHRKAEILLCPTTQAAMINHDSGKANVVIRWATKDRQDYTVGSLDELAVNQTEMESYNTRLMFEYVATRDIQAGEELYLDYGSEWEEALKDHVEHGSSQRGSRYVSAKVMSEESRPIVKSAHSSMLNHSLECNIYPNVFAPPDSSGWEEFTSNQAVDKKNWAHQFKAWYKYNDFAAWYPCRVIEANSQRGVYDIEMMIKPISALRVGRRYRNVPRNRIRFADGLYQSDQHLAWSFRHYIPIPDSIFPLRWREDYKTAKSWNLGTLSDVETTKALVTSYEKALREAKCGAYIAKSNIPNAGFGTYTAIDIPAGGIPISTTLPVVPSFLSAEIEKDHWPGRDYVWSGEAFGSVYDGEPSMLAVLFGALANAHAGITNLEQDPGTWDPVLDRTRDPGAGAISDYVGYSFISMHPVSAGEELFVSYGENWFLGREQFAEVPMKGDFGEADTILAAVWSLASMDGSLMKDKDIPVFLRLIRDRLLDPSRIRIKSALNAAQSKKDLRHIVERNGTATATVQSRLPEWLDENGKKSGSIRVQKVNS
jgi:hypothetical protein